MRRPSIAIVLLLATVSLHAQRRGAVDWIFLVDTSKSMRGVGGTRNIFGDVKASIDTFVREANEGDSVAILTFDRDVQLKADVDIRGATAKDDLRAIVDGLYPNGDRTHLGLAIQKGLERAAKRGSDATRVHAVVLFTDGKEDVRGIRDPVPISSNLQRVGDSHVYFVSLGDEHETQLDDFARASKYATVLQTRDIAAVADRIRKTLPEPKPEPVAAHTAPVMPVVKPTSRRWLILIPILAAAAFIAYTRHKRSNHLEGELEILQPHVASDSAFVGLPRLAATELALSAILPFDVLGGGDARLFVRRRDGDKKVFISARSGALRVNDVETPECELYDADTIQIGDAKLRFNRVGHERPQEDL